MLHTDDTSNGMTAKRFTIIIICYSLLIIVSILFFWWLSGTIDNSFARIGSVRIRIQQLEKEREAVRGFVSLLESRELTYSRIQKFLVRRDEPLEFIETLENTAKTTGNITALDFDAEKSKKGDEIVFRVMVDGTRSGLLRYIKLIELLPYHIRIDEITYQKFGEEIGPGINKTTGGSYKKLLPEARIIISIFVKAS